MPLDLARLVLYRDAHLIILDKPPGWLVHPGGRGDSPAIEPLLDQLREGFRDPPRLGHRLDRDTSGCLVLARHDKAARKLGKLFMAGGIAKTYWAVARGKPQGESGRIDAPLLKKNWPGGWQILVDPAGQSAVTDWRVLGQGGGLSWIEAKPLTGRTHQIRVHLAHLGCPILGDPFYGGTDQKPDPAAPPSLHLLARAVEIPYSAERPPIRVEAPPPPHMRAALKACGWAET